MYLNDIDVYRWVFELYQSGQISEDEYEEILVTIGYFD